MQYNSEWLSQQIECTGSGVSRSPYPVFVTPELALAALDRNTHNRPLTEKQVLLHIARIRDGFFIATPDAIAFDDNGVLLEGQHRLSAIARGGKGAYLNFDFGYPPETFSALGEGKPRSISDHQGLAGMTYPRVAAAAAKVLMQLEGFPHSDHQAVNQYIGSLDQGVFVDAIKFGVNMKDCKLCSTSSAMGAAYYYVHAHSPLEFLASGGNWYRFIDTILSADDQPALVKSLISWLKDKRRTDTREGIPKCIERVKMFAMAWVRFNEKRPFVPSAHKLPLGEVHNDLETLVYAKKGLSAVA